MAESAGAERFVVPATHRLRFTRDVLGEDHQALTDVLEPNNGEPARVQFWIDQNVSDAQPELRHKLRSIILTQPQRLQLAGNIQIVPGGECVKNEIHLLERMLKVFHAANLDRWSYVVVVGGGAVLDAVGFAAAIAHRGLRLVRLPTTTLGQADSGVAVKNGMNLFGKKNWLGSFAVPWAVINDASMLRTLSDRDFICGFSEAVKVALLKDARLFEQLCMSPQQIRGRDLSTVLPIIRTSAEWHLRHITRGGDPFETTEARPLDFGHWSAHKLETLSDFELRHGEAVAIGVVVDTVYSSLVHGFPKRDAHRVLTCLLEMGFSLDHPALHDTESLFQGLEEFRQHLGGRLTLTMLTAVAAPKEVHEVDKDKMRQAIRFVTSFNRDTALSSL